VTDFKDVYAEGITVGMALGRKQGLSEAIALLLRATEQTAAAALAKHYEALLAEERASVSILVEKP
jgi:hypothetical protein